MRNQLEASYLVRGAYLGEAVAAAAYPKSLTTATTVKRYGLSEQLAKHLGDTLHRVCASVIGRGALFLYRHKQPGFRADCAVLTCNGADAVLKSSWHIVIHGSNLQASSIFWPLSRQT